MVIWDVIFILYIHHFCTIKFQIRSGTITQMFLLQLRHKTNRWKCTMMDPYQGIENYRSYRRTSILDWIRRTHMAYPDQNGKSIHNRKSSWKRILVHHGSSCSNDAQPSSRPLRPETHHTFWVGSQRQTKFQDMVWIILHRMFQSWHRQQ